MLPVGPMTTPVIYILVIINFLTSISSSLINFCFIAGILTKKKLVTPTNLFVVSLSVSDFLVGILSQPLFFAHLLVNRWTVRNCALASVSFYTVSLFCGVSGLCLPAISLDRYIRMKKLQYYRKYVTIKRVVMVIIAIWINAALIVLMPMVGIPHYIYWITTISCLGAISIVMSIAYASLIIGLKRSTIVKVKPVNNQRKPSFTSMNSGTTAGPATTIATTAAPATTTITQTTAATTEPMTATSADPTPETTIVPAVPNTSMGYSTLKSERMLAKDEKRQMRITITVALLVVLVIASWTPCLLSGLIWSLGLPESNKDSKVITIHYFSILIGVASSSVNPLLYCWRIREVRKAALDIFQKILTFQLC